MGCFKNKFRKMMMMMMMMVMTMMMMMTTTTIMIVIVAIEYREKHVCWVFVVHVDSICVSFTVLNNPPFQARRVHNQHR